MSGESTTPAAASHGPIGANMAEQTEAQQNAEPALVTADQNADQVNWLTQMVEQMEASNPELRFLIAAGIVAVSVLLWLGVRLIIARRIKRLSEAPVESFKPLNLQRQELFSAEDMQKIRIMLTRAIGWAFALFFLTGVLTGLLMLSTFTQFLATRLLNLVFNTVGYLWHSFIDYLPNLVIIVVILLVVRWLLHVVRLIFDGIATRRIRLRHFYPEWADTSFTLLKLMAYTLTVIVIFPYLPGSDSPAFQGISIFIGVLVSLGSTTAVANVVAGVVLTYTRAFSIGDQVEIAGTRGKIVERSMFVTRMQTLKNVQVSVPNAMVLNSQMVNFSQQQGRRGLLVHTKITIGYDVPWQQVHELLLAAATKTENIEAEPEPFVLQTSLDDYYVSYEINAWTHESSILPRIYSALHANILDEFHASGVEILSPAYQADRDGSAIAIPKVSKPSAGDKKDPPKE